MINWTRASRLKIRYFARSRVVEMKNRSPSNQIQFGMRCGRPSDLIPATVAFRGSAMKALIASVSIVAAPTQRVKGTSGSGILATASASLVARCKRKLPMPAAPCM